VRRLA
jgi:hypothetical protein